MEWSLDPTLYENASPSDFMIKRGLLRDLGGYLRVRRSFTEGRKGWNLNPAVDCPEEGPQRSS